MVWVGLSTKSKYLSNTSLSHLAHLPLVVRMFPTLRILAVMDHEEDGPFFFLGSYLLTEPSLRWVRGGAEGDEGLRVLHLGWGFGIVQGGVAPN